MTKDTDIIALRQPESVDDPLTEIARDGARRMLAAALRAEAEAFVAQHAEEVLPDGRQRVVRHGYGPERSIQTGIGALDVRRPKVRDRAAGPADEKVRFSSAILPKWARRSRSLDALLPVLYLRGISTGDFREALSAILGTDAPNLSPSVISRLTEGWQQEYDRWQRRDLSARRYVYIWADGVYLQARMEPQAECILVILGATPEGKKEVVGFQVGMRESAQSWRELLVDIKARGLAVPPEVAVGDGAMGFWKALDEVFPGHAASAVLGPQDRQCPEQVSEVHAADGKGRSARDLAGRHPRRGGNRHGHLLRKIRRQIREGGHLSDEGQGGVAHLLRLSG